jgi:glutathione S-transferase
MKLIQIPFSHNCVKVRVALERKHLACEIEDIKPTDRGPVFRASGQGLVPVLLDGGKTVADSTAILLYLEDRYPDPALVPSDPARRAECLVLEDWADRAFMALTRRIAYHNVLSSPGKLGRMFFPNSSAVKRRVQEHFARKIVARRFRITPEGYPRDAAEARAAAALAVARLGAGPYLLGREFTIADVALATMSAPLAADPEIAKDQAVAALLAWATPIAGAEILAFYRGEGLA